MLPPAGDSGPAKPLPAHKADVSWVPGDTLCSPPSLRLSGASASTFPAASVHGSVSVSSRTIPASSTESSLPPELLEAPRAPMFHQASHQAGWTCSSMSLKPFWPLLITPFQIPFPGAGYRYRGAALPRIEICTGLLELRRQARSRGRGALPPTSCSFWVAPGAPWPVAAITPASASTALGPLLSVPLLTSCSSQDMATRLRAHGKLQL